MEAPGASRNRADVGNVTSCSSLRAKETTVPPGATRRIACESVSPPTPSITRSNRSPSGSRWWTISSAPRSSRPCARSGLRETAVTCAPARLASCTAKRPTPPEAPVTSARRPRSDGGPSSIAYSAVRPATGSVAAWASVTASGRVASVRVGTATFCAHAPSPTRPTTRVPPCGPLPSRAARSTTPATSQPATVPGGWVGRRLTSPRLSETARTATSASLAAGSGSATSVSSTWGAWSRVVRASTGATYTAGCRVLALPEWSANGPARPSRPRRVGPGGAPAGVGGRAPVAARGAVVAGAAAGRGGRLRAALAAPARPRPDRALQGVPAAEAQDAGLRGPRGRPLPHPPDAHDRGDADLADGRPRARSQRGPRRGDRAGARSRPPAVRPHRRGGARPLPGRALWRRRPPLRATPSPPPPAGARAAGGGRRRRGAGRPEPLRGRARRHPVPLRAGADAADARGPDRAARRPRRLPEPRHRRRDPGRRAARGRASAAADRGARRDRLAPDRHARARPRRDVGRRRRHRPGRRGGGGDGRAAPVHVRARLPRPDGVPRAREDRARRAGALRLVRRRADAPARRRRRAGRRRRPARDGLHRRHDRPLLHPGVRGACGAGGGRAVAPGP